MPGQVQSPQVQTDQPEGLRETIESVVIALILAFVFRAFIVEAFVIPTGSMAATLDGAHGTLVCSNCGWENTYGLTDPSNAGRISHAAMARLQAAPAPPVICQNCRYANPATEISDAKQNCEAGDRILVLKWPFDIGGPLLGPHRWDVVVFKDPSDGTTNYIKRLVGLPGEVLQIVDGDIYTVPNDEVSQESMRVLNDIVRLKYWLVQDDRRDRSRSLVGDSALHWDPSTPSSAQIDAERRRLNSQVNRVLTELDGKLQIVRKPALAQQALWTVVYNHDYTPHEHGPGLPCPFWQPLSDEGGWSVGERTLSIGRDNSEEQTVQLMAAPDNFCSYNIQDIRRGVSTFPVSDLRTRFVVHYIGGDGDVAVKLVKREDEFIGRLAADGTVTLLHGRTGARQAGLTSLGRARIEPLSPGDKFEFCMENLDHRVAIQIRGHEVLATSDEQYRPSLKILRGKPEGRAVGPVIMANRMELELTHVVVERDAYYISDIPPEYLPFGMGGWGTEGHPILIRDGEYYFLGDNSAQSKDSRLWDEVGPHLVGRGLDYQLGTVPRDQLIGRAFFVYWPSGLRTKIIPFLRDVGWIPNFGRMRWIR